MSVFLAWLCFPLRYSSARSDSSNTSHHPATLFWSSHSTTPLDSSVAPASATGFLQPAQASPDLHSIFPLCFNKYLGYIIPVSSSESALGFPCSIPGNKVWQIFSHSSPYAKRCQYIDTPSGFYIYLYFVFIVNKTFFKKTKIKVNIVRRQSGANRCSIRLEVVFIIKPEIYVKTYSVSSRIKFVGAYSLVSLSLK
jgi:hypothetical protein